MSAKAVMYARRLDEVKKINRSVLKELAWLTNDSGDCWAKVETLAEWTGWGETSVKDALKWLRENGYLICTKRGRLGVRSNEYRLTFKGMKGEANEPPAGPKTAASRPLLEPPADPHYLLTKDSLVNEATEDGLTPKEKANAPKQNPSLLSFLNSERSDEDRARLTRAMVAQCPGDDEAWHDCLRSEFARVGVETDAEWETCAKHRKNKGMAPAERKDFFGWLLIAAVKKREKRGPVKPPRKKNAKPAGPSGWDIDCAYAEAIHAGKIEPDEVSLEQFRTDYLRRWHRRAEAQRSGPRVVRDEFQEMKDELEREQAAAGKVIPIAAAQPLAAAS